MSDYEDLFYHIMNTNLFVTVVLKGEIMFNFEYMDYKNTEQLLTNDFKSFLLGNATIAVTKEKITNINDDGLIKLGVVFSKRHIYMTIDSYISEILVLCGDIYKPVEIKFDSTGKSSDKIYELWLRVPIEVDDYVHN